MSALDQNTSNPNLLNPQGFKFQVKKLPMVNYFLQGVTIPGITLPATEQPTPFVKIPLPGDHIDYGVLNIKFKVDEDLTNYRELHSWIRGLGFPTDLTEYAELAQYSKTSGLGITSDAAIIITTGLKNPNVEFLFEDCFPVALGELELNTTDTTINFMSCSASFAYTMFQVNIMP
jgi:hypothetical protein